MGTSQGGTTKEAKLYGRLHKCDSLKGRIDYLGFEVSEGVHVSPEKVKAIVEWLIPSSVKDVRSFLGLALYYQNLFGGFQSWRSHSQTSSKRGLNGTGNQMRQ